MDFTSKEFKLKDQISDNTPGITLSPGRSVVHWTTSELALLPDWLLALTQK